MKNLSQGKNLSQEKNLSLLREKDKQKLPQAKPDGWEFFRYICAGTLDAR